jgi:hypothetical protein
MMIFNIIDFAGSIVFPCPHETEMSQLARVGPKIPEGFKVRGFNFKVINLSTAIEIHVSSALSKLIHNCRNFDFTFSKLHYYHSQTSLS